MFAIIFVAVIIVAILTLFNKKSDVLISLQVEALSFKTQNDLINLFALSRTIDKTSVFVQHFSSFEAHHWTDEGGLEVNNTTSSDISDRLILKNVYVDELDIPKGVSITLSSTDSEIEQVSVHFQDTESNFNFHPIGNDSSYNFNDLGREKINEDGKFTVKPSDGKLNLSFRFESEAGLMESEIIKIDHLVVNKMINPTLQPSIKSGKIEILSTGEELSIHKNARLYFQEKDIFLITDLFVKNGLINVVLEGSTSSIYYGSNRSNIIPNYLYFFAKNNFVLIIFNTVFVLITFMMALVRFTNEN
ncbi:hypothetical protein [Alteromonas lipolytica]|uniref:hypothetical protein n=1 Tax=Alteromonas lipolytica TaxID=1856405 RepID=UPI0011131066|nr:hypothetical protein [Alteromonas lipolytica]